MTGTTTGPASPDPTTPTTPTVVASTPGLARRIPTAVWVMTASALLLRLAVLLLLFDPASPNAMEHQGLATSLLLGDGFAFNEAAGYTEHGIYEPSSVQSPVYPLFLAGLYWTLGTSSEASHLTAAFLNVLAGAATVPMVYLLTRRLARGEAEPVARVAAVVAAGIFAIAPSQIYSILGVQAIIFIVLGFVTAAWLWYVSLDTGRLLPWIGYSFVGCLTALTEPVLLPAMALSGVWVLLTKRLSTPLRIRNGAILLATALAVIGPWTWRNYRVHDAFVPIKATFWVNVWKGNNGLDEGQSGTDRPTLTPARLAAFREAGQDEIRQYDLMTDPMRAALEGKRAVEREAQFGEWAKAAIAADPVGYARVSGKRLAKTLWWDWDNPQGHQFFYMYPIWRGILLVGSVAGLVVVFRRAWRFGYPTLVIGVAVVTYTLTVAAARFAVPLEPFQYVLCAAAVAGILAGRLKPRERPTVVAGFLGSRGRNDGSVSPT
jgi:hypothetical protein